MCVGAPVVAVLGASYIGAIFNAPRWVVVVIAVLIFGPPLLANAFGLRVSGPVQLVLTAALVTVVIGVVAVSAPAARVANVTPFLPHGWVRHRTRFRGLTTMRLSADFSSDRVPGWDPRATPVASAATSC